MTDVRQVELERLASMPSRLAAVARTIEPDTRIGEWTVREVVLHLAAVEEIVWQARLSDLETTPEPVWSWTEPGAASAPGDDTLGGALAILRARRDATIGVIRGLSAEARRRVGVHETYGRLDLAGLLRIVDDHDEDHLADLSACASRGS